jgi:flagellar basal body-associated protein FliL
MVLKLQLCFTERDKEIAEEVKRHSCKSGFIKDVLLEYIRDKKKPENKEDLFLGGI